VVFPMPGGWLVSLLPPGSLGRMSQLASEEEEPSARGTGEGSSPVLPQGPGCHPHTQLPQAAQTLSQDEGAKHWQGQGRQPPLATGGNGGTGR
uniref:Uncharacterized protein n=1 Tax=Ficedula albicollis TaxID=59894 RepID=A0A803VRT8_FICAL